jgi:tetratricopeptide (TPR) repeat protein
VLVWTARVLFLLSAAQSPAEAEVQAEPSAEARARFRAGFEAFDAHHYPEALAAFRASLTAFESPSSRLYIARCLSALGREDEAAEEYERLIALAAREASEARYAPTQIAANDELRALERGLGRLRVSLTSTPANVRLKIGARVLGREALGRSVPVKPGAVIVGVEVPGQDAFRVATDVEPGREHQLIIDLADRKPALDSTVVTQVVAPSKTGPPIAAYAVVGTGVAAMIASAIVWIHQANRLSTLDEKLAAMPILISVGEKNGEVAGINRERLGSGALFGAGLVLAVGGVIWLLSAD